MATSMYRNASPSIKAGKTGKDEKGGGKDKDKDAAKKVRDDKLITIGYLIFLWGYKNGVKWGWLHGLLITHVWQIQEFRHNEKC